MAKLISTIEGHKDRVWCVSWNPQGSILASCSSDKSIRLHGREGDAWQCRTVLAEAHSRTVRFISWSPSGKSFASSSFDSTVNIWDGQDGAFETVATLEGHENEVKGVAWSPNGSLLATCSRDKSVWIWEVGGDEEFECISVLPAHTQDVKRVIFNSESNLIVSTSYDNTLKVYREDDDDWVVSSTLSGHESTVWCVGFSPSGNRLISGSSDNTLRVWQRYAPGNEQGVQTEDGEPTWKCVCVISGHHGGPVYDVTWCPLTNAIATACGDDTIRVFVEAGESDPHAPTFELVTSIREAHAEDVNSVAWHPITAGLLASASDDGSVKIWDLSAVF